METAIFWAVLAFIISWVVKAAARAQKAHPPQEPRPMQGPATTVPSPEDERLREAARQRHLSQHQGFAPVKVEGTDTAGPEAPAQRKKMSAGVTQRLEHRMTDISQAMGYAEGESGAGGSLGVAYAGEGSPMPLIYPASVAAAAPQQPAAEALIGLMPHNRQDFIKGLIFSEAVMKRGGRRAIQR